MLYSSGDRTVTGHCETPVDLGTGASLSDLRHRHTLLLSCTDISQQNSSSFTGLDCVNGSMLGLGHRTSQAWDWSSVRDLLQSDNKRLEIPAVPSTPTLRIFGKTRVSQSPPWVYLILISGGKINRQ